MTRQDQALALAARGFRIFPLAAGSKKPPRDLAWKQEATTDPDRIRSWWETDPLFNIGVATGQGVLVIDADTKDGRPGLDSLSALDIMGLDEGSFRVRTPSGGVHVYVKTESIHGQRVDTVDGFPGIDIRCDGGYVVGPGSVVDGSTYEITCDEPLSAAPWFDEILLRGAGPRSAKTEAPLVELDQERNVERAQAYLADRAPEAIEGAGGNDTTYRVATRCRDYGLSEGVTLDLMLEHWNEQKASPPWTPDNLAAVVGNAYQYASGGWGAALAEAEFGVVDLGEDDGESPIIAARRKEAAAASAERSQFHAAVQTFAFVPPSQIPPREWLYDRHYVRKFVSVTVAPGGVGKSSAVLVEAMAMVTAKPLLGVPPPKRLRVFYWSGEDPQDETRRRLAAIGLHYGLENDDLGENLLVASGDELPIKLVTITDGEMRTAAPRVAALTEYLRTTGVDVMIVDPFVSSHSVSENSNEQINEVIEAWRNIARQANCAIELVHHATKAARIDGQSDALGMAQGRGASALVDGARSGRYLTPMSPSDAQKAGLSSHRGYFRVEKGKANMAPADAATWRRLVPVSLGNGRGMYPEGDSVGVVERWEWPSAIARGDEAILPELRETLAEQCWRADSQSHDWVGYLIAHLLRVDVGPKIKAARSPEQTTARHRVKSLQDAWTARGDLREVRAHDRTKGRQVVYLRPPA